jgi:acetyl-CoA C-acetyltransferase
LERRAATLCVDDETVQWIPFSGEEFPAPPWKYLPLSTSKEPACGGYFGRWREVPERVAIVGVGCSDVRSITPGLSYKEMMYEAAVRAYADARINPRKDVDSFICVSEDFWEGTSIFDEYVPDQLGAALRPVHTVTGDGIQALACAAMLIRTGRARVVVVEGHSKASDIRSFNHIHNFAYDPIYYRPLAAHPQHLAGLEMNRFLHVSGNTREQCGLVVRKNLSNGLRNPRAVYGADVSLGDVLGAPPAFEPLGEMDIARPADGGFVMVVAGEAAVADLAVEPVWIAGYGWSTDSPAVDSRRWDEAVYARLAAEQAYGMAGITNPFQEIDFAEIDDSFSYKELEHMEALRLCRRGEAGSLLEEGVTLPTGDFPVNVSGGSLGGGHLLEATGLGRVHEVVLQLRGQAGPVQLTGVERGLAQSWRNLPTTTGCVIILEKS